MDLGSQATARAANRLIATVFFDAPAESGAHGRRLSQ
jgi:hypothetical protein